jgi:hypothetical protein
MQSRPTAGVDQDGQRSAHDCDCRLHVPASRPSLPEIDSDGRGRVVPQATPGIILSGLARLGGREVSSSETKKQVGLLFKGARQVLDKAVYGTFFAGPAAVLYGYQQLLRLAGKDVDSAFPDGTWQFYLEFALREDSARHASETTGFHDVLSQHRIRLSEADMLAAWLWRRPFSFPAFLTSWRTNAERVALRRWPRAVEYDLT